MNDHCKGRESGRHCWHHSNLQHAMVGATTYICCHCGVLGDDIARFERPAGHGPNAPETMVPGSSLKGDRYE